MLLPHIEAVWAEKGETLPRPDYTTDPPVVSKTSAPVASSSDAEDDIGEVAIAESKKKNFEATSDEGE